MDFLNVNLLLLTPTSALKTALMLSLVKLLWQINEVSRRVKALILGRLDDALVIRTRKRQSHGGAWGRWTCVQSMWPQSLCPGHKWPAPSGAAIFSIWPTSKYFMQIKSPTHGTADLRFGLIPLSLISTFTSGNNLNCIRLITASSQGSISEPSPLPSTGQIHRASADGLIPHAARSALVADWNDSINLRFFPPGVWGSNEHCR